MFTIENFCDVLKDEMGVKEVILEQCQESAYMEIRGEYEGIKYKLKITNADFAEHGI